MTTNLTNARPSPPATLIARERTLERTTFVHVAIMVIGSAWAFGGNAPWARNAIAVWGSGSLPLFALLVRDEYLRRRTLPRILHSLWPLVAFNVLIVISAMIPNFRPVQDAGVTLFIPNQLSPWFPSSARPDLAAHALWVFDGIYLTAFNLFLGFKNRRTFQSLLLLLTGNALVLAVFGTLQKLVHAKGLYFGLQPSPQPRFFASFIYANHWGAFMVPMLAIGLGLWFHFLRRFSTRELLHSPAMLALITVGLLAISAPLSGSRSAILMALLLLFCAFGQWTLAVFKQRKGRLLWSLWPVLVAAAALLLVGVVSFDLGKRVIEGRWGDTRQQIDTMRRTESVGGRMVLYHDTWRMARQRWLFGWGMGSYPTVFYLYNSQQISPIDHLPNYYHDAHSDWLQSVAEVGAVGTLLLGLSGLLPFWRRRHTLGRSPISTWLLGGCATLLLYAWVEFPFGNTAVVIAFWVCFFTALQYGRVERATD